MTTFGRLNAADTSYNDFAGNIWFGSAFAITVTSGNAARVSQIDIRNNGAAGVLYRFFVATVLTSAPVALIGISGSATSANHSGTPGNETISGLAIDITAGNTSAFIGCWVDLGGANHFRPAYTSASSGSSAFKTGQTFGASPAVPTFGSASLDTPIYDIQATFTIVSLSSRKSHSGILDAVTKTVSAIAVASAKTESGVT